MEGGNEGIYNRYIYLRHSIKAIKHSGYMRYSTYCRKRGVAKGWVDTQHMEGG